MYDNGAHSRIQFLAPVSHSMAAHTEALWQTADSSSSSDEDETWGVTSDNARVARIACDSCSSAYVCIKRKIQKILTHKVRSLPVLYWTLDGSNSLLYAISVQSSTVWQPIKLPPFARPIRVSVRAFVRDKSEHCEKSVWDRPTDYYRKWIISHHRAIQGPNLQPHDHLFPKLGADNL